MKRSIVILLTGGLLTLITSPSEALSFYHNSEVQDSVKTVKENGRSYILHKVEKGETLFRIAQRYHCSIPDIKEKNPSTDHGLKVGQELLIPYATLNTQTEEPQGKIHVVKTSETLYSISRLYNVSVDDLKKWNNLKDNNLSTGEKLIVAQSSGNVKPTTSVTPPVQTTPAGKTHVVKHSETLYSISRIYNVSTDDLKKWNNLSSNNISTGQVLRIGDEAVVATKQQPVTKKTEETPVNTGSSTPAKKEEDVKSVSKTVVALESPFNKPNKEYPSKTEDDRVFESGTAEVMDGSSDTKKYLALHRKAPIGTIMQVSNEMNNQKVFVRVIGTIPDTGDNSKVLIKLSKKAYDRLGAVNSRFPVTCSYIP